MREQPDGAACLRGGAGERAAQHPHLAGRRAHEPRQEPEERALPGAVRARHGQRLAGNKRQVDVVENPDASERAAEAPGGEQRLAVTGGHRSARRVRRGGTV